MSLALGGFMPKTTLKLSTFKIYQQPRKAIIVCGNPHPPKGSTGKGGKINSEKLASLDSAQIVIKETEKNKAIKEDSSAKYKSKASN